MSVDPTKEQVKALLKMPKDKPVTMVNLLKFKEKTAEGLSGEETYLRYSKKMEPLLKEAGAEVVWYGRSQATIVGPEGSGWDAVAIVRYPGPRAFIKMSSSELYQSVGADREAALEKTVLLATYSE